MLPFKPSRIWLCLFSLSFFFSFLLILPKKVLAAHPTANINGPGGYQAGESYYITINAYDTDGNLSYGQLMATPRDPGGWQQLPYGAGWNFPLSSNYTQQSVLWTPPTAGWYYLTANIYDSKLPTNEKCSANPYLSYPAEPCLSGWCYCGAGDLMDVYVAPSPPPATPSNITGATFNDWHNPYEICWSPEPAESQLLSTVYISITGVESTPSPDYNKVYYYLSYQSGDNAPLGATLVCYNASGQLVSCSDPGVTQRWWRYTGDITPYGLNRSPFPMSVKGLTTGNRTVRINLYDTATGSTRDTETYTHNIDRTPPNYSGSFPAGQQTCSPTTGICSPELRAKINNVVVNSGTQGETVALEPYTQRADSGGFSFHRVDLWVAKIDGDVPTGLSCPPNPPYVPSDGDYFSCNPSSCDSFGLGIGGQAWYIGSIYGASGGTVSWNTTGFAIGTRTIVANIFDNPSNTRGANFLTYTGNGVNQYFSRVDFNLTLPLQPWIKTTGGNVHSNAGINTQGGPP